MNKFWCYFFIFWPIAALVSSAISPVMNWLNPGTNFGWGFPYAADSASPLGMRIDNLYYLIMVIVVVVFIGTQIALGYVLLRGTKHPDEKPLFIHGSHNLEVIWTIVPSGILLFVALYQMDVWAEYRIISKFPQQAVEDPIAEVTARQFEWRIRYPGFKRTEDGKLARDENGDLIRLKLQPDPQPTDLYTVNDLHVPSARPVMIQLRSGDVQHSFFVPELRVKQDAVPGLVIPVWFEVTKGDKYELLCAELCGWGHYKMRGQVWAQPQAEFDAYLEQLQREQDEDGVSGQDDRESTENE